LSEEELNQLGKEIDLMQFYPQSKGRLNERPIIVEEDRVISRKFGLDYFDGDRKHGYGGFSYHPRFWTDTVKLFASHYGLSQDAHILDVGCAKGFMLKDFRNLLPKSNLAGIDISDYAIEHADLEVKDIVSVGDAVRLPFGDNQFDLVISINTLHNLDQAECVKALTEIERVSKGNSFVMVDGWRTKEEQLRMESWVLTAKTMMSADEWVELFQEAKYSGDYWFWTVS
jgi:ubiquinone/menaquinone biosynthesis C-methylase UbiE